jgi:DNA mismatch repair protein MutS
MFFDDARVAAPILEVVLTSRDKKKENSIPLCGIPYHARDLYAAKLLRAGHKIAICEQVEDPALSKGLVKRAVTHILTPGTALELDSDLVEQGNFISAIFQDAHQTGLASLDLSQSSLEVRSFPSSAVNDIRSELYKLSPREILFQPPLRPYLEGALAALPDMPAPLLNELEDEMHLTECEISIKRHFSIQDLDSFGLLGYPAAIKACASLLTYLQKIRQSDLQHIHMLNFSAQTNHLTMDAASFRNLDILLNSRTGNSRGSLLEAVDMTVTTMGRRLLRHWLTYPSTNRTLIETRQDSIESLGNNLITRSELRKTLKGMSDTAKIAAKIALDIVAPGHLLQLKKALQIIPKIKDHLKAVPCDRLDRLGSNLDPLPDIAQLIEEALSEEGTGQIGGGTLFKSGFNRDLDELRSISHDAKTVVAGLEQEERKKTGISTLKIRYNRVFGYYIEITNTHLAAVPPEYIRKQTLVNCERFITGTLKELEEKILKAEEKLYSLEKELFSELILRIRPRVETLQENADILAELDVLAAGAELSACRSYTRPQIRNDRNLRIEAGRHPVIELNRSQSGGFVPNDLLLTPDEEQILLITGPNMGGKSTYLRQTALIVILAQIGYFVPAEKASIGICDRIFTRIGASDSLIEGKSTFLVEMTETAAILSNSGERSLILLDEIGRGTSTFDGLSIAWAVVEHLHHMKSRPKTLFATHYHELTELAEIFDRIKNYHISVREWQDKVIFLHKIVPGATDQSFGIHVAKIAGLPGPVVERAKEILLNLEKKELNRLVTERITGQLPKMPSVQTSLFPQESELKIWDDIKKRLGEIKISELTPLEALNILHYLQRKADEIQPEG